MGLGNCKSCLGVSARVGIPVVLEALAALFDERVGDKGRRAKVAIKCWISNGKLDGFLLWVWHELELVLCGVLALCQCLSFSPFDPFLSPLFHFTPPFSRGWQRTATTAARGRGRCALTTTLRMGFTVRLEASEGSTTQSDPDISKVLLVLVL